MNRERELLQRLVDSGVLGGYSFIAEVKELLDQPEQEIACWGSFDLGGKCVGTHETRRLAAQIQGGNDVYPLYTSPPKREPLSEDEVAQITQGMSEFGADMFKAGIAAAEKAHKIGIR